MSNYKKPKDKSPIDLTYYYAYLNCSQQPSISELRTMGKDICTLLSIGWTDKEIINSIKSNKGVPILDLMNGQKLNPKNKNILDPYVFYYHTQLRIIPPTTPIIFNDDDTITQEKEEYYLEMKASYTMNDLCEYYIQAMHINREDASIERCRGAFTWALKKYNIDLLLYMIDAYSTAVEERDEQKPLTPIAVSDFLREGRILLNSKKTEAKDNDYDFIVPRRRNIEYGVGC